MIRVDIVEKIKIAEMTSKSICSIFSQSRSRIQLTQSKFKLIKYGDNRRKKAREKVKYEDIVASMANILVIEDKNCLLLKINIKYAWAKFM